MKTYILIKNKKDINIQNAEDIKVSDIYGIYQNKCKAFWECRVVNLKNNIYTLKEINLETNEINNSFYLKDRTSIIDENGKIFKIPVFYNDIENDNSYNIFNDI